MINVKPNISIQKKNVVRQFTDIDLNFVANPLTGDISKLYGQTAINRNLRNLILTKVYENPFHPEKSCQVNGMLFENVDYITAQITKRTIEEVIYNYEPRIKVDQVVVTPNLSENEFRVDIYYTIINTSEPVVFTTTLKRIR